MKGYYDHSASAAPMSSNRYRKGAAQTGYLEGRMVIRTFCIKPVVLSKAPPCGMFQTKTKYSPGSRMSKYCAMSTSLLVVQPALTRNDCAPLTLSEFQTRFARSVLSTRVRMPLVTFARLQ